MGSEGRIWRKSSKTPVFIVLIYISIYLYYYNDRRLSSEFQFRLQATNRDRGHDLPRRADLRPSPLAIHRGGEDPPAARRYGGGDQWDSNQQLAKRQAKRSNEDLSLHEVDGPRGRGLRNSPAVSKVRENHKIDPGRRHYKLPRLPISARLPCVATRVSQRRCVSTVAVEPNYSLLLLQSSQIILLLLRMRGFSHDV